MLLFLSKLLPALLLPPGLIFLLCLAAGFLALRSKARTAAMLAFAAAFILYVASSPVTKWVLLRGLEKQYSEPDFYPRAPAIVLLGGAMLPDFAPRHHPETNAYGDRVFQAGRLWREHLAPKLVVTGGNIPFLGEHSVGDAVLYARLLHELFDVPDSCMLKVSESKTTYEDALFTARLFEQLGMPKVILLVTSAQHMPRAARLFRKQGFKVIPAPTDYHVTKRFALRPFLLIPSEGALNETLDAMHEYIGLTVYYLMGRL